MLWFISDFSKYKNIKEAENHFSFWLEKKITKITFRNFKKFDNNKIEQLAEKLSNKYKFAEIFLRTTLNNPKQTGFLHLTSSEIDKIVQLKKEKITIAISAHIKEEVEIAFSKKADYVFLSPIFPPLSKPQDKRKTVLPIKRKNLFLLGGLNNKRIEQLKKEGFENFAGITLFYNNKN